MSNMCIDVEFLAGTSIEAALLEASLKAKQWGVAYVKFDFNGISVSVKPNINLEEALYKFNTIAASDNKHKFVVC